MALPKSGMSFDVSLFSGFLDGLGPSYPPHIELAFEAATYTIQHSPISHSTFRVEMSGLPCIGLELLSIGKDGQFKRTGLFVAYVVRNELITPVDVARLSTVFKPAP